ncbi:MAG: DUF4260 domain-containing protein [Caldilineales bacterium]|nr:DUF4260 domain-containing protein [Caldilineales bacterium]MCW5861066.1 DUF4260 domain-containing protein [Caldilineales bacterium]
MPTTSRSLPKLLLHLEGGLVLALALFFYARSGQSWLLFGVLLLAPDLSALGYLAGPRLGSIAYNGVHTYLAPGLLLASGSFGAWPLGLALALIWFAHIGGDRLLGFGLKYPTRFQDTHLQRL